MSARNYGSATPPPAISRRWLYGCGFLLGASLLFALTVWWSGAVVEAGHVGVVSYFGKVDAQQTPLTPGFNFVWPFTTHVEHVSTQPQNHTFKEVGAASKELQNVFVDGGVNYHIDPGAAAKIVIAGSGHDVTPTEYVVRTVFDPAFQDYIKEIVPTYKVEDILANRATIRDAVKVKLAVKAAPLGITVDDVFITNIHFDPAFEAAIAAKQVATQKLEQAKIDADTAAAVADGQKRAQIAQAEGDAQANKLRQQSLTAQLIQYLIVQKWNGVLPLVTGNASPFISISGQSPVAK